MKTIALYNLKGGVGKTTTAVNLAWLAAESKKNTILWDWDPQAAATWCFQLDPGKTRSIKVLSKGQPVGKLEVSTPHPRLRVIPADLSLRTFDTELAGMDGAKKLVRGLSRPLGENASYLLYDCPPTLSPSIEYLLSEVDVVLVPIIPTPLSLRAATQVVDFFAEKKRKPGQIVGFFNQVDGRKKLHRETIKNAASLPFPMLKTIIPMASAAEKMSERREPLTSYAKNGKLGRAYQSLWRELRRLLR